MFPRTDPDGHDDIGTRYTSADEFCNDEFSFVPKTICFAMNDEYRVNGC